MDYSLEQTYYYILEKADKIGSDFFQLPVILSRFQSATFEFLNSKIKEIELTQKVSDDVKPLIVPKKFPLIVDTDLGGVKGPLPNDYYHLLSVKPLIDNGILPRQVTIIRTGQNQVIEIDPFNKPTPEYPVVSQYENYINVNTGSIVNANYALIMYIKKPIFAALNQPTSRIVNLSDNVIESIIEITVKQLFATIADTRVQIPNTEF